jgi:transposase
VLASAVDVRREALGQLRAVIVTAPDQLRAELRRLPLGKVLDRCSRLRHTRSASPDALATRLVLRSLARRIQAATVEAAELERQIEAHVKKLAPALLDEPGVGPIVTRPTGESSEGRSDNHASVGTRFLTSSGSESRGGA